tara:strand:+ start:1360 stop:3798 length:2439 start_codon:yes stop_codon:yes gene_type:complete
MQSSYSKGSSNFPDPLAPQQEKSSYAYGKQYARAIERQWGNLSESSSLLKERNKTFDRNREYANGTQDTTIYKQILTNLDPNNADGSLVNIDYTPVPILPKFAKIVANKILSRDPYPNLEAIDPLSVSEKQKKKNRIKNQVKIKETLVKLKEDTGGAVIDEDPDNIPDTLEEAEILMDTNVKTDAEIAAQIGTNLTLSWNNFNDNIFRRVVNDLVACGMGVVKRTNDPSYGIREEYVDPMRFIHSYTEDPSMDDLSYAGHVKSVTIAELKRLAGDELSEKDFEKIAKQSGYSSSMLKEQKYDKSSGKTIYGYDQHMVDILEFEFLSVDCMFFEDKENKYGNRNFFYQGFQYKEKKNSVYERSPSKMEIATIYGGTYIMGCNMLFGYGLKTNIPRNVHDISRARLSYSAIATNIRRMMPKSIIDGCIGFADMLQITHLKLQQAIAKAKPDGLIIDIEGLENVQLGKGGDLQPLELHDIYEQTGVFYYRSKNPEGGFQNPPVRTIDNHIRNINELVSLYNHYLRMIRDATGINEMMDGTTPKGDTLVGVQQNAIAAGNNAIYDITHSAMVLYKKVCEDIIKCLQILPTESVIYSAYRNAIGQANMEVLTSFSNLPMYNFGVRVVKEMEDKDRMYLEQNIQMSIAQKELDIEDAIAIRNMKDVNQAERLLVVRRAKRMKKIQEMSMMNSQQQAQIQQQSALASAQMKQQESQMQAQIDMQMLQAKNQFEVQRMQLEHQMRKEIELIRAQATLGFRTEEQEFKEKLEVLKEDRKDRRVKKQAVEQSKLISQRQQRGPVLIEEESPINIVNSLGDGQ